MKKSPLLILVFGILLLFIIQSAGTLVESIYILDLLHSGLDVKVLGVLFFFVSLLFLPLFNKYPRPLMWAFFAALFISRGLVPYLSTANRMIVAGIATAASLALFFLLLTFLPSVGRWASAGLAIAVSLSSLLRAAGHGIEYSLAPAGAWVGWVLGLALGFSLYLSDREREKLTQQYGGNPTTPVLGIYLVLTLVYFSVSAPAVIARWTEQNYTLIIGAISLLSLIWVYLSISLPDLLDRITPRLLLVWNLLFTASLTLTLLAQRVSFPPTLDSAPVVVGVPTFLEVVPLALLLLLFPVLFLDLQVFVHKMQLSTLPPRSLAPGIVLGSIALIVLVFINIFSNVWGYVKPISPPLRNTFWLVYFLLSASITLLAWRARRNLPPSEDQPVETRPWQWAIPLVVIFLVTLYFAVPAPRVQVDAAGVPSLRLMTMNTQQSNNYLGEKSFEQQLALIRQVNPDILTLQETDSARISLNNNDYVRAFADRLGYYSYYGPKPVAGTYGTAILSKFPLIDPRTAFMFSDKDETGVAEAEVEVGGKRFTIYDVHPDGSDPAMVGFAKNLLDRSQNKAYVIAMGDYNLRDYEEAYKLIDRVYTNSWTSVYPSEISPDGVDMSGENRIDHIFLSPNLTALEPTYILPPESGTDHPVHWTDVVWSTP